MLVREQPATELAIATRILARAGALAPDGRITMRLRDVVYIGGRHVPPATITPYDVAVVLLADGSILHGSPPLDLAEYLAAHEDPAVGSAACVADGTLVSARDLRTCTVTALRGLHPGETPDLGVIEETWLELVAAARVSGALIGAFPTDDQSG